MLRRSARISPPRRLRHTTPLTHLPPTRPALRPAAPPQGCALPIELWFFTADLPDAPLRRQLEAKGVIVRDVDEITPGASAQIFKNGEAGFGYVMKARAGACTDPTPALAVPSGASAAVLGGAA